MKTSGWVAVVVVVILALGGWYYVMHMPAPAAQAPSSTTSASGSPGQGNSGQATDNGMPDNGVQQASGSGVSQNLVLGQSSNASLGTFLTAYNGMTLYMYTPDTSAPGKSVCNGGCAAVWPPYTVASAADIHVPATLVASKVSTVTRNDGTLQVSYSGKPLYFYVKDKAVGDVAGQGVGGVWYVVKP